MARAPIPSLTGLRAFDAYARTGAMTRAAEALGVTHGAVSRQIKTLEQRLGARLVSGPRHALVLTPAGRTLATALSSAFDLIAAALPGAEDGEDLIVSCLGTFAMKWLIPRLPSFLDANPGVRVPIVESYAPVDFGAGDVHAAIRVGRASVTKGVRAQPFMAHYHGPVLSPARFEKAAGAAARLLELPRLHSETFLPAWENWARTSDIDLPPASLDRSFEHNFYMLEAAAAGLGVAVAPWAYAQPDIERGRLVAPWGFQPVAEPFTYLRPSLVDHPGAAAFGDWLKVEGRRSDDPPAALI